LQKKTNILIKTSYNKKMRTQTMKKITCIFIFAMFLLTACSGGAKEEPTPTVDNASIIATSIAQTMQVMAETQTAQVTPTLAGTATSAVVPTITPATTSAGLPTATVQTVSLPTNCLIAGLASETIPDGTIVAKGATFTKTWSITNGGTCTWNTGYKMVFQSGDLLGATSESVALTQNVAPGTMTNVSIKMTAPSTDGWYTGNWQLQTDGGVNVGNFTVSIYVGVATAAPFSVTSVTYPSSISNLTCDGSTSNPIYITTDAAGTVTYNLYDINGYSAGKLNGEKPFTSAGSQTIYYNMVFPVPGADKLVDVDIQVYIDTPNHQDFYLKELDGKCK
jgi:hypothetical protein